MRERPKPLPWGSRRKVRPWFRRVLTLRPRNFLCLRLWRPPTVPQRRLPQPRPGPIWPRGILPPRRGCSRQRSIPRRMERGRISGKKARRESEPSAYPSASSPFNVSASERAERRLASSSSRVLPWQLTPGTSSTQPIHQSSSCLTTAVKEQFTADTMRQGSSTSKAEGLEPAACIRHRPLFAAQHVKRSASSLQWLPLAARRRRSVALQAWAFERCEAARRLITTEF